MTVNLPPENEESRLKLQLLLLYYFCAEFGT